MLKLVCISQKQSLARFLESRACTELCLSDSGNTFLQSVSEQESTDHSFLQNISYGGGIIKTSAVINFITLSAAEIKVDNAYHRSNSFVINFWHSRAGETKICGIIILFLSLISCVSF